MKFEGLYPLNFARTIVKMEEELPTRPKAIASKPRTSPSRTESKVLLSSLCEELFQIGLNKNDTTPPQQKAGDGKPKALNVDLNNSVVVSADSSNAFLFDMDILDYEGETMLAVIHKSNVLLYLLNDDKTPYKVNEYKIKLTHTKVAEPVTKQDVLHVCKFGFLFENENSNAAEVVIVLGGTCGHMYVLSLADEKCLALQGHVSEVYDLCLGPWRYDTKFKNLLLSCSRDGSVGLWNFKTRVQIASYKSGKAPVLDAISIDWHTAGEEFLQTCIDGSVSVWELGDVDNLIKLSGGWTKDITEFPRKNFLNYKYKNIDIHENYVDSARYMGDMIVSKDVDGKLALWINSGVENEIICFSQIMNKTYECVWSLHLHVSNQLGIILYGNDSGEILLVKMGDEVVPKGPIVRFHIKTERVVRKAMLTKNCDALFAVSDDGNLWYQPLNNEVQGAIKSIKWTLLD